MRIVLITDAYCRHTERDRHSHRVDHEVTFASFDVLVTAAATDGCRLIDNLVASDVDKRRIWPWSPTIAFVCEGP